MLASGHPDASQCQRCRPRRRKRSGCRVRPACAPAASAEDAALDGRLVLVGAGRCERLERRGLIESEGLRFGDGPSGDSTLDGGAAEAGATNLTGASTWLYPPKIPPSTLDLVIDPTVSGGGPLNGLIKDQHIWRGAATVQRVRRCQRCPRWMSAPRRFAVVGRLGGWCGLGSKDSCGRMQTRKSKRSESDYGCEIMGGETLQARSATRYHPNEFALCFCSSCGARRLSRQRKGVYQICPPTACTKTNVVACVVRYTPLPESSHGPQYFYYVGTR